MSKNNTSTPSLLVETFMSVLKCFIIIVVLNNIIWAVFFFKPSSSRIGDTHVEVTQNGNRDIKQDINS
jgi:hypothetical protein